MKTRIFNFFLALICGALCRAQNNQSEEITLYNDSIQLAGTLSIPTAAKKPPLLIFVHGSGNIDRNGNQGPALQLGYLKALSDALNARGIATYRYDKRTSSIENLKRMKRISIQDYADDARLAIDEFTGDKRFGGVHVLGHSQGSLVALLAGQEGLSSYTSLAGASSTIDSIIVEQIGNQLPPLRNIAKQHFEELSKTDTILQVNPMLAQVFAAPNQRFLKNWSSYDPREKIRQCTLPTLIIQGLSDIQVPLKEGLGLAQARNAAFAELGTFQNLQEEVNLPEEPLFLKDQVNGREVQLALIPKLNHIAKEVNSLTENQQSYSDPSIPLSRDLVEVIADFLNGLNE